MKTRSRKLIEVKFVFYKTCTATKLHCVKSKIIAQCSCWIRRGFLTVNDIH